jgi:hypothetical protein
LGESIITYLDEFYEDYKNATSKKLVLKKNKSEPVEKEEEQKSLYHTAQIAADNKVCLFIHLTHSFHKPKQEIRYERTNKKHLYSL